MPSTGYVYPLPSSPARHQQYGCRRRQQPCAAAIEYPFPTRLGKPAAHVQAHIGVGADGDPFQHQKKGAQHGKLRGDGLAGDHELREEGGEDQDGFLGDTSQIGFQS